MRVAGPPRLAVWLLQHAGSRYRRESLAGDLIEQFQSGRSDAWFWRQVLQAVCAGVAAVVRRASGARPDWLVQRWREYWALLLFVVLMGGFRSAWADWVYVPTGSMNPTILEGDRLLIDKHIYGVRVPFSAVHLTDGADPARGDIIVFNSPRAGTLLAGTLLVKRVIALPGDTVALEGERLFVNGIAARYRPGDDSKLQTLLAATQRHDPALVRESGVLPEHDVLLLPDRLPAPLPGPITVPKGMYFVLGDNRDNSADSRYIGFVPRRNIVGRATRVVLSLNPDRYYLPRPNRAFITLD
jgi:signal peptidase I